MAKFDNIANRFNEVRKTSNERANEHKVVWIKDEDLIDNPRNEEDCDYIEDLVAHIDSQGFNYELTVTQYGAPAGKYMIISGHRRRRAGREKGYKEFPCIVKDYASEADAFEALLTANSTRNTDRDPLLYSVRYRQYIELLDMKEFKGSYREEIAKRLGLSVKQADKYKAFLKIIPEFWVKVRTKECGMEPLLTLATETEETQRVILEFINKSNPEHYKLNSKVIKDIIDTYRENRERGDEVIDMNLIDPLEELRPGRREREMENFIPGIKNETVNDVSESAGTEKVAMQKSVLSEMGGNVEAEITGRNDTEAAKQREALDLKSKYNDEKPSFDEEDEENIKYRNAAKIYSQIKSCNDKLETDYEFESMEEAKKCIIEMADLINNALCFMETVNNTYQFDELYNNLLDRIEENAGKR